MNYLLDTCVLSELRKVNCNEGLLRWSEAVEPRTLFISTFTLGEIQRGIARLPSSHKRKALETWLTGDVLPFFEGRTLGFHEREAICWGNIQAESIKAGKPLPAIDGLIAAVAIANNMIIVTRNLEHFDIPNVKAINPWL